MRRDRKAKIVATLGPATASPEAIRDLFVAGADVFRLNFSHGTREDHAACYRAIRELEEETGRTTVVLQDLQGPKLRVGEFAGGEAQLVPGSRFRLDLDDTPGNARRAPLAHPEVYGALKVDTEILLDDGRVRLRVRETAPDHAETKVLVGGAVSDRKGVNVPGVTLPIEAVTDKDREDLEFGLSLGVDWVALSFVQRPEDVERAKALVDGQAAIMAKIEKPAALARIDRIVERADGIMVARGDLGVELVPEEVPGRQKELVRLCRLAGKPVVIATQMLDSMVQSPEPTRAEASDVATAINDGADAVMLSAESAVGDYPREAVAMMSRIIERTEREPSYRPIIEALHPKPQPTAADAISAAVAQAAQTVSVAAIVTYTASGSTAARMARERPAVPILTLTNSRRTARRSQILWGTHCVFAENVTTFHGIIDAACRIATDEGLAVDGQRLVITAGVPFGQPGTTNTLRIATVGGE